MFKNNVLTLEILPFKGVRVYLFQVLFLSLAVLLPVAAHLGGAPVRWLLPMHFPVIFSGLVYGWRGGLITGLFSSVVSHMISGFPLLNILPAMTVELTAYGFITGLLIEKTSLNPFVVLIVSLIVGRILFVLSVFAFVNIDGSYTAYFSAALLPGIAAAVIQITALPFLAKAWTKQERKHL